MRIKKLPLEVGCVNDAPEALAMARERPNCKRLY